MLFSNSVSWGQSFVFWLTTIFSQCMAHRLPRRNQPGARCVFGMLKTCPVLLLGPGSVRQMEPVSQHVQLTQHYILVPKILIYTHTHTWNRREKFVKFCFRWWSIPQLQDKDYWTCGGPAQLRWQLRVLPTTAFVLFRYPLTHSVCFMCWHAKWHKSRSTATEPHHRNVAETTSHQGNSQALRMLQNPLPQHLPSHSPTISLFLFFLMGGGVKCYSAREISFCH